MIMTEQKPTATRAAEAVRDRIKDHFDLRTLEEVLIPYFERGERAEELLQDVVYAWKIKLSPEPEKTMLGAIGHDMVMLKIRAFLSTGAGDGAGREGK